MSDLTSHCAACRNPRAFCLCSELKGAVLAERLATERADSALSPVPNQQQYDGTQRAEE